MGAPQTKDGLPLLRCTYPLDQRCDPSLVRLCQESYRLIHSSFPSPFRFKVGNDKIPDAVQIWVVYYAMRVYGAADAALTLIVHNLTREAVILQRQIFEYAVRAEFYAKNPGIALLERDAAPFREFKLLENFGFDRNTDHYKNVLAQCKKLRNDSPEVADYAEKHDGGPGDLRSMLGPQQDKTVTELYAYNYKFASQVVHGSVLDHRQVFPNISFDSSGDDPNPVIIGVTNYVCAFLTLMRDHLGFDLESKIVEFHKRLQPFVERYSG